MLGFLRTLRQCTCLHRFHKSVAFSVNNPMHALRSAPSIPAAIPTRAMADPRPFRRPLLADETRSIAQVREHYAIEVVLADRLRNAGPEERPMLYRIVYDELFRRLPHHPQLTRKQTAEEHRIDVDRQLAFLRPHLRPQGVFMEIGAGDCALSLRVADLCGHVYAVDVSREIARGQTLPANCDFVLSSGCDIPVPPSSVDVAYSNQLMEHLHPDDADTQLRNIHHAIRPGGKYVCVTPNRVSGPWDVSMYLDEVARGMHLREYSIDELLALLRRVGFGRVDIHAGGRGFYMRVPRSFVRMAESLLECMPYALRSRVTHWMPVRGLLGLRVVAWKI